jgi:hypothetical protein
MPSERATMLVTVEGGVLWASLIRPEDFRSSVRSPDSMAMTESTPSTPFDTHENSLPVIVLSAPSEGMLTAARALVQNPRTLPSVEEPALLPAVERVFNGLDDYDTQLCDDVAQEPPGSPARSAFELALAQRISSTKIALDCDEALPEMAVKGEGELPAHANGRD